MARNLWPEVLEVVGERAGARTPDPLIKSQMLYRLSYALLRGDHMGRSGGEVNKQGAFSQSLSPQRNAFAG